MEASADSLVSALLDSAKPNVERVRKMAPNVTVDATRIRIRVLITERWRGHARAL